MHRSSKRKQSNAKNVKIRRPTNTFKKCHCLVQNWIKNPISSDELYFEFRMDKESYQVIRNQFFESKLHDEMSS